MCELKSGIDRTQEVSSSIIKSSKNIKFTCQIDDLDGCDVFVITVPTPVDQANQPDLSNLIAASELVASKIRTGGIVVFESTVFPGATEEILAPIIQKISGLEYNKQFFCGYSPERINPGDKSRQLQSIVKITSGSNSKAADTVDQLLSIIPAGTYKVSV